MNEIDPASNGSITTTDQEPTSSANHTSPLLSSLLSNGQQNSVNLHRASPTSATGHLNHGVMPTNATTNDTNNSNAFMTNNSRRSDDLTISNHRKYSNLSDLLQRNNNNNKVPTDDDPSSSPPTAKSILENCLMKPSLLKSNYQNPQQSQSESQAMDHHHSPTTSSVLKYAPSSSEDNRKVEPIKINLNREPIRTVIKLPPQNDTETSPSVIKSSINNSTVSPTLSSSSHSSESSYDNCNSASDGRSSIQVIPKLHIRNLLDSGSLNHEQSEPHIVPKIKITGLSSPPHEQQVKEYSSVNSNIESSPAIPKITIKKDNNDYHLNNDNSIPRLHIKNHHHHHHHKDEKPKSSVPKMMVSKITDSQDTIPKLTLKQVNNSSASPTFEKVVPKLLVKIPKEPEPEQIESSSCSPTPSPPQSPSPIVSKLIIKPIPLPSDKEVPKTVKNCVDAGSPPSDMKFTINRLIGSNEKESSEPLEINTTTHVIKNSDSGLDSPRIILKINKTNNESITSEIVPQPTTEIVQKSSTNTSNHKRPHSNDTSKLDAPEVVNKKSKLDKNNDELIIINDSDTSSSDNTSQKNHKALASDEQLQEQLEAPVKEVVKPVRSLRQRRNHEAKKEPPPPPVAMDIDSNNSKENSLPEIDPQALSNDATSNTNSMEDSVAPTPKRGRGRPKKIVSEKPSIVHDDSMKSLDPPDTPHTIVDLSQDAQSPFPSQFDESSSLATGDETSSAKKTPGTRGRGRGRGRGKRVVEVVKNGKPVQITLEGHDDDDSPSFSLYNRSLRGGYNNTGNKKPRSARGRGRGRGTSSGSTFLTPEKLKEAIFTSPEQTNRKKLFNTPSIFEEDTRMSIGGDSSCQTPMKSSEMCSNEESQSSLLSSASNTVEGSVSKKRSKKMEVCEPEGRIEFSVDMLSEYDWPQNEPPRNRETYMIQEQICEYLGVKSFKRKYPDLHRRPVDMEERNFLFENGLASEKMCDLGLTALYASEVLDIMCNDYPEKYEEYKRYQRERAFQFARQRFETAVVDRSQMQKDKAISSASEWNSRFNKDRKENRRSCMDLQNFLIQLPNTTRKFYTTPSIKHRSHYPVSVVPGQFSEYYEKLNPLQLACYPLNTILVDRSKLENYLATHNNAHESSDESDDSDSEENGSSSSDSGTSSDSESSSDDDYEDPKCLVCSKTPFQNQFDKPEKFVKCSKCKNQSHPSCIEMSVRMYQRTLAYPWQCSNCKNCYKCRKAKDNKMLYCVQCDRGFHIYCLGLRNVPEGQYHCDSCNICSECGSKSPEGHFDPTLTQQQRQDLAMIAQWNHEFIVNPLTKIREHVACLCLPCYRKSKRDPKDENATK